MLVDVCPGRHYLHSFIYSNRKYHTFYYTWRLRIFIVLEHPGTFPTEKTRRKRLVPKKSQKKSQPESRKQHKRGFEEMIELSSKLIGIGYVKIMIGLFYLYCNKFSIPHELITIESETTIAAVANASASMHVGAMMVALTILFTAGRPVRGSIV